MKLIIGVAIIFILLSNTIAGIELKTDLQGIGGVYSKTASAKSGDSLSTNGIQSYHSYLYEGPKAEMLSSNYTLYNARHSPSRTYSLNATLPDGSIYQVRNDDDFGYVEGSNKYAISTKYPDGTVHFIKMSTEKEMFSRSGSQISENDSFSNYRVKTVDGELDLGVYSKNYLGRPNFMQSLEASGDMELSSKLKNNITPSYSGFDDLMNKMESISMMDHGKIVINQAYTDVYLGGNAVSVKEQSKDSITIGNTQFNYDTPRQLEKKTVERPSDTEAENVSDYWVSNGVGYIISKDPVKPVPDIQFKPGILSPNAIINPTITVLNAGGGRMDSVSLSVGLPSFVKVINSSDGKIRSDGSINWEKIGSIDPGDENERVLAFRASVGDILEDISSVNFTYRLNYLVDGNEEALAYPYPIAVSRPKISLDLQSDCNDGSCDGVITYLVNVSNAGDDSLADVYVVDELPDGVRFIKSYPSCAVSGRTLKWQNLGKLESGESQILSIEVNADRFPEARKTLVSTVTAGAVSDSGARVGRAESLEINCINSSALVADNSGNLTTLGVRLKVMSAGEAPNGTANLTSTNNGETPSKIAISVTKKADRTEIDNSEGNRNAKFTISITNTGDTILDKINVRDQLPIELNYTKSWDINNPSLSDGVLTWDIDIPLHPGEIRNLTYQTDINDSINTNDVSPELVNNVLVNASNTTSKKFVIGMSNAMMRFKIWESSDVIGSTLIAAGPAETGYESQSEMPMRKHLQLGKTLLRKKIAFVGEKRYRESPNEYYTNNTEEAETRPSYNPTSEVYVIGNCSTIASKGN
jgi:uncharacterized repeat protein (TIGR01451 family)